MKRVFLGLLVAAVALSASAFTNVRTANTVYITGETGGSTPGATWDYSGDVPNCTSNQSLPCRLNRVGSYTFPDAPSSVLKTDVSDAAKVTIASTRASF